LHQSALFPLLLLLTACSGPAISSINCSRTNFFSKLCFSRFRWSQRVKHCSPFLERYFTLSSCFSSCFLLRAG
jgi:hypothetical protein